MVTYYVKITEEIPSDGDDALWFSLESGSDEEGEFFALRRNEFNALVRKFEEVQESYEEASANFNENVMDTIVAPAVSAYMENLDSVEKSTKSLKLVDSDEENAPYYTYSSLTSKFSDMQTNIAQDYNTKLDAKLNTSSVDSSLSATSKNPVQNKVIKSALDNKANSSTVSSLKSTVDGKAPSSHNHSTWTKVNINDYSYLYYNSQLKLVFFRYYKNSYKFTGTDTTTKIATIPSAYRPRISTPITCYSPHVGAFVYNDTGVVNCFSDYAGTHQISIAGMWFV